MKSESASGPPGRTTYAPVGIFRICRQAGPAAPGSGARSDEHVAVVLGPPACGTGRRPKERRGEQRGVRGGQLAELAVARVLKVDGVDGPIAVDVVERRVQVGRRAGVGGAGELAVAHLL